MTLTPQNFGDLSSKVNEQAMKRPVTKKATNCFSLKPVSLFNDENSNESDKDSAYSFHDVTLARKPLAILRQNNKKTVVF